MGKRDYPEWYRKNHAQINAQRRDKYANDPEYRRRALERALKSRALGRKRPNMGRTSLRTINGNAVKVHTIGYMAHCLGRGIDTLKYWRETGWLPPSRFPGKQQVYTDYQVGLVHAFDTKLKGGDADCVKSALKDMWSMWDLEWR